MYSVYSLYENTIQSILEGNYTNKYIAIIKHIVGLVLDSIKALWFIIYFKGEFMDIIKFICKYTNLKIRILSWVFLGISVSAFILGMVSMFDWIFTELASTLILSMAASLIAITLILLKKN